MSDYFPINGCYTPLENETRKHANEKISNLRELIASLESEVESRKAYGDHMRKRAEKFEESYRIAATNMTLLMETIKYGQKSIRELQERKDET